jgi:hypothetical protein
MNDERPTDLLSALPRTRPHRRSDKRGARSAASEARSAAASAARKAPARKAPTRKAPARKAPARTASAKPLRQPAQPGGIPDARRAPKRKPAPAAAPEIVGTAVQAVGELAEIGLTLTARALRNAVSRLPRP